MDVGSRIRAARLVKHMSQRMLAELAAVSPWCVSSTELGRTNPSLLTLHKLATALGLEAQELIAGEAAQRTTGLTYDDLVRMYPEEDLVRRELIDGELFVTPSPITRHQRAVTRLLVALGNHAELAGGEVLPGPLDIMVAPDTVLEPDVLFYVAERTSSIGERPLMHPPTW